MSSLAPMLLLGVAGLLVGGVWSLRQQGASRTAIVVTGALAVLALVGGLLWLWPEGGAR
ncbi:MAG: hypothetical protein ACRDTU_07735 [Micromonosporaceae bacterium]